MSTPMTQITPKEKRVYDFRSDYVQKQINSIKHTFSKKCLEDDRLSDKYKAYVKDIDNIFVDFKPVYGFDCKLSLGSVRADVSFSYVLSYVSSTTVSGTATVDSSGDVKLSNVHSTDNYSHSREQKTNNAYWFSSVKEACILHVGGAAHREYNLKNYEDITDKARIPSELAKMAKQQITYEFLNPYITPSALPSNVYDSLISKATEFYGSAKNITMDSITDYYVDACWITYLPYTYEFDVWCDFEGKTYQQHCKKISDISSIGQLSDHYEKYCELLSERKYDFSQKMKGVRVFYFLSIIFSLIGTIGFLGLLIFGKQLHVEGLRHFYLFPMIALCAGALIMTVVGIVVAKKERPFRVKDNDYNPNKSHAELAQSLQNNAKRQCRRFALRAVLFLTVFILILGGLGTGAFFMCKDIYAEYFLYTPEIIGTYYSNEDGIFEKLTIISCDNEGKVEAISEASYQQYYSKCRETGEIIRKDSDGLQIRFTFDEALYQPEVGSFKQSQYATFSKNYIEISNYSDATMIREENWFQQGHISGTMTDTQLGAYYIYSKGEAKILELYSFDENGTVSFSTSVISKSGYNKTRGEGKILMVNPDGSCFVDFQMLNDSQVGYVSADGKEITCADEKYSKNKGNVKFINSTSDLLNMKDYAANPCFFVLTRDIDFEGESISKINAPLGMLFGNGHTIKNFVVSRDLKSSAGLFGTITSNAIICDLVIENGRIETTEELDEVGLLCGYLKGTLINVTVFGTVNAPNATHVGTLAGQCSSSGQMIDCNDTVVVIP